MNKKILQKFDVILTMPIVLFLLLMIIFILWIPNANLPIAVSQKYTNSSGKIPDGNLWKTYYGKTENEVRQIAPMYEASGKSVLLDLYEEDDAEIGLMASYKDGKVYLLNISITNYSRNRDATCTEKMKNMAKSTAKRFAPWMGFNLDDLDSWTYEESGYGDFNHATMISIDLPGATCSFNLCPSSLLGFTCREDNY